MTFKRIYSSPLYMVFEFLLFYISVPFIVNIYLAGWYKIIPLFFIAVFFLVLLLKDTSFDKSIMVRLDRQYLKRSVARMSIIGILVLWFTYWVFPGLFFNFPVQQFKSYVITLFLYPVASVLPQEIIYRMYYFHRYKSIIPEKYLLMLSNAVIFGLAHLIYGNWIAPVATFLVSWIFIFNYLKTRSLLNVSLEHYFYGLIMFTVGFGYFFQ